MQLVKMIIGTYNPIRIGPLKWKWKNRCSKRYSRR